MSSFAQLINQEEELLKRLLLVSQKQKEVVRDGNMTLLLQHLGQRQRLQSEFDGLEQELKPYKSILPEQREWKSSEEKEAAQQTIHNIESLLKEILENDDISFNETKEQKIEVEKQLHRVQQAKQVVPAYAKQSKIAK